MLTTRPPKQFLPIHCILKALQTLNTSNQCSCPKNLVSVHVQNVFSHSNSTLNPVDVHLYLKNPFYHTAPLWWRVSLKGCRWLTAYSDKMHLLAGIQNEMPYFPAYKTHFFPPKMWPKFELRLIRRG
jgi:hypothetical protein